MMRFAYARRGGPIVSWAGAAAPSQSRAGETRGLGGYHHMSKLRRYRSGLSGLDIPRPGSPEMVGGYISPQPGAAVIHLGEDQAPAPMISSGTRRKLSAIASAYHGVRRNNGSVMWGVTWAVLGYITMLTPVIAVGQGFAKPR
jgi:hypothetical protein